MYHISLQLAIVKFYTERKRQGMLGRISCHVYISRKYFFVLRNLAGNFNEFFGLANYIFL